MCSSPPSPLLTPSPAHIPTHNTIMPIAPEDFKGLVASKLIRYGGDWADVHIKSAKGSTLFVRRTKAFEKPRTWTYSTAGCQRQKDPRLHLRADECRSRPVILPCHTHTHCVMVLTTRPSSHPEITAVIQEQVEKLMHLNLAMVPDEALECAEAITSMLPAGLDKCMLLSTGSETNEFAMKLAKVYTGKFEVVSLSLGYRQYHAVAYWIFAQLLTPASTTRRNDTRVCLCHILNRSTGRRATSTR
jgi:hypothetical protein